MDNTKYFEKIKEMFVNKKPNIIYGFEDSINSYEYILDLWKKYYLKEKLILPEKYIKIFNDIFKFHKMEINHIIAFQSSNLSNSLLLCRMDKRYFNILVPKIPFDKMPSFIATFT